MAKVSVIGLGKLGAPLAAVYSSKGHKVIGLDLNEKMVNSVNAKIAPVSEPGLQELISKHPFQATTSYEEAVKKSDTSFVIVPTPSDETGRFDSKYVIEAVEQIGLALKDRKRYHLVVICSTTMPGEVAGPIQEALEAASGRVVGNNLGLCYSPEFIALGSVIQNMLNPDMVLIGESSPIAGDKLARLTRTIVQAPIKRMGITNAEIAKIAVNTYITMKISYANILAEICENVDGGDAYVVADAVGLDSRIGRKYLTPGTAYGGPCFPRDTVAFGALTHGLDIPSDLSRATRLVNEWQTDRLANLIGELTPESSTIAVLGTSYKPGTHITDESPGLKLRDELMKRGFDVRTHDPSEQTTSINNVLAGVRLAIIMTPWDIYGRVFPGLFETFPTLTLIDCWNLTERGPWDDSNVIRIGVRR